MKVVEKFIEEYFINNKIPLFNRYNNSHVDLCIYGYRKANMSSAATSRFSKKYFPNKPKNMCLYTYILQLENKKYCKNCDSIKNREEFNKFASKKDELQSRCRECDKHPSRARAAKRKAAKLNRTPAWADLTAIKEFYSNCPEGYHVDHIIPLQGKNISGLHILENLQYLPAKENQKKGNKFNADLA